ncbi:CAP domain-containing protein [Streptomyces sp. NPDC002758]
MGKHSKKQYYRRIVIAAVVLGAVGVPSVAMACTDWPGSGGNDPSLTRTAAAKNWWNDADWYRQWNEEASAPASATPEPTAPSAASSQPMSPHHKKKHKHTKRKHWPTATHRPSPSTQKPTTSAPSTPSAPASSAAPAAPSTPKPSATASGVAAQIVQLVNAERSKVGCSPLTLNAALTKAAQAHSADMAAHQNMSHTGSDGSDPGQRITSAGYNWSAYGENVAYGYATAQQVMAGWMSSPGHKANILNCTFKEIGVGLAQPNSYWTQDFGTAR